MFSNQSIPGSVGFFPATKLNTAMYNITDNANTVILDRLRAIKKLQAEGQVIRTDYPTLIEQLDQAQQEIQEMTVGAT